MKLQIRWADLIWSYKYETTSTLDVSFVYLVKFITVLLYNQLYYFLLYILHVKVEYNKYIIVYDRKDIQGECRER